jgi:cell division protein FtsN
MPASKYTTGEWLFSGSVLNINTNLTTYALFVTNTSPTIYSNLALSFRLPAGIVCMPQVQYGYTQQKLLTARLELQKHLSPKAFLNLSFEHNRASNINTAQLQFRYDFSFAQAGFIASRSNKKTTLSQYARGSIINDRKTRYLGLDNRTNVGKGGISIIAFLDLNSNGKRDKGEPKVNGLNLHANGGRVEKDDRDSTIRILGLEPYTSCFIELDPNSFENVSWRLPVKTLSVVVDPNILKSIEIPVSVVGEATGNVFLIKNGEKTGQSRMIVDFYSGRLKLIGKTLTEDNGYFSYFGLVPGNYTVRIDTGQLHKLGMSSDPGFIKFDIRPGLEGEVVDKLDFTLKMNSKDTTNTAQKVLPERQRIRKDTTFMIVHEVTKELVAIPNDSYSIQLGAFKKKSNAESLRIRLQKLLGRKVDIITEDGFYKVRINDIKDRKEADDIIAKLQKNGTTELWLINMRAMKQKLLISQKQDTITQIIQTITKEPAQEADTSLIIQAGAFFQRSNANALRDRLSQKLNQKVVIIYEDGYYKVRLITPYILKNTVLDRIDSLMPTRELGLKKLWIIPFKPKLPEESKSKIVEVLPPAKRYENVSLKKAEVKILVPETKQVISSMTLKENKIKTPPVAPQPTISIQAGIFYSKSQALKAQRRIKAKLNLNVEIEQQWDFYRVIIPGFFTREETYKYYPELAGLGYPGVSLIEKK